MLEHTFKYTSNKRINHRHIFFSYKCFIEGNREIGLKSRMGLRAESPGELNGGNRVDNA